MTPAIHCLEKANIKFNLHTYDHDPTCRAYGEEAAEKLNISNDRIYKTLVVSLDRKDLAVAVVPVSRQLDLKAISRVLGSKKTSMADKKAVERATGYVLGGVSPMGQKKRLKTVIDDLSLAFETVFVSAGRRGLQIEISPRDLGAVTAAAFKKIGK